MTLTLFCAFNSRDLSQLSRYLMRAERWIGPLILTCQCGSAGILYKTCHCVRTNKQNFFKLSKVSENIMTFPNVKRIYIFGQIIFSKMPLFFPFWWIISWLLCYEGCKYLPQIMNWYCRCYNNVDLVWVQHGCHCKNMQFYFELSFKNIQFYFNLSNSNDAIGHDMESTSLFDNPCNPWPFSSHCRSKFCAFYTVLLHSPSLWHTCVWSVTISWLINGNFCGVLFPVAICQQQILHNVMSEVKLSISLGNFHFGILTP